jgi:transposase
MTGVWYRDEILAVYVRPYASAVGPEFILMDDNTCRHRTRVAEQYLQQETIVRVDWPARSPELNPIEHVRNMLQIVLSRRRAQSTTLAELSNAFVEVWNNLPVGNIWVLIDSMA